MYSIHTKRFAKSSGFKSVFYKLCSRNQQAISVDGASVC